MLIEYRITCCCPRLNITEAPEAVSYSVEIRGKEDELTLFPENARAFGFACAQD